MEKLLTRGEKPRRGTATSTGSPLLFRLTKSRAKLNYSEGGKKRVETAAAARARFSVQMGVEISGA